MTEEYDRVKKHNSDKETRVIVLIIFCIGWIQIEDTVDHTSLS